MKNNSYFYNVVVCGGTFDRFHKGHKEFILFQLQKSKNILIGVTTDKYIALYKKDKRIQSYSVRRKALQDFLRKEHVLDRVEIAPIDTLHIPLRWEKIPIDAIVVSEDTYGGAMLVNARRKKQLRKELPIIICEEKKAQDGMPISSSRIREGKINREGKPYVDPLWLKKTLLLTEKARKECRKPFGTIITTLDHIHLPSSVATVGDITSKFFNSHKLLSQISIVDFHVGRKKTFSNFSDLHFLGDETVKMVKNPPSTITPSLFRAITDSFDAMEKGKKVIVKIDGEEDLSVLPLLLLAPLGFTIFYGQPGKGMVKVNVTEKSKEKAYSIIQCFSIGVDGERS